MRHPWSHWHPFANRAALRLAPELAHRLALRLLSTAHHALEPVSLEAKRQCMGMEFSNPIGLAAGLDKNAVALEAWHKCGFGFAEIGAITPRPQGGNPSPRLFRLPQARAFINRMGFNNDGMHAVRQRLERHRQANRAATMRLGVNLGKNKDTPLERAHEDYTLLLESFWTLADYLCLNISSPNTPQLRDLGQAQLLDELLDRVCATAEGLRSASGKDTPLALKIDPDRDTADLAAMAAVIQRYPVRAIVATNTTCQRPASIDGLAKAKEDGGLSGEPLAPLALATATALAPLLRGSGIEIIGCGGISSPEVARRFIDAGASMLQVYTGFVYQGPQLLADLVEEL